MLLTLGSILALQIRGLPIKDHREKYCRVPTFVSEVLLEFSHIQLYLAYGYFGAKSVELNSSGRDLYVTHEI